MSLLYDLINFFVRYFRQALWIFFAQAIFKKSVAIICIWLSLPSLYLSSIYLISEISTYDIWVSTFSEIFLILSNLSFSSFELVVYFMMLSSSLATCYKMLMFRTILDYLLFRDEPFLLGDNSVDLYFVGRPLADVSGVGAVCFFLEGCWEGYISVCM